ncbi:snare domain-containing protein [Cystoisospora suis]|uniref:Snare domain-containing protein n=1 Tax=Cystoisospora suis TaxID=483139 RepID=A0A2C6KLL3_9APIC|nr:snare domain-containing protein [Cystoisospora suis]
MSFQQPAAPLSAGSAALSYSTAGHGSIPQGDFEGGVPAVSATGGSDSTNMDQKIRANIQTIRTNLLAIQENLGNLNRRFVSRRIVESLHDRLRETYDVVLATERLFKAWQVEQQKQPMDTLERQRIRFLYDKLSDHFQEEIKKVHEISERVREAAERVADSNSSPGSGSANTLTTPCGPPSSSASSPSRDRHSPSERSVLNMDASGSGIQEDTRSSSTLSNRGWRVAATTNTGPGGGGDQGGSSSRLQGQGGLRGTELSKPGGGVVHRGNHHGDGLVLDLENVTMLGEDDRDEFFIGDDDEQEMCKYVFSAED